MFIIFNRMGANVNFTDKGGMFWMIYREKEHSDDCMWGKYAGNCGDACKWSWYKLQVWGFKQEKLLVLCDWEQE